MLSWPICVVYFHRLLNPVISLPSSPEARRFVLAILLAFLPAVVIGVLAHGFIKSVLFSPYVVSVALIRRRHRDPLDRAQPAPPTPFRGGSLFAPAGAVHWSGSDAGDAARVSRSGATILGALMMGVERRTAAEFSFFLAIPH